MVMHSATSTTDVSLAQEFPKHLSNAARKNAVTDQVKCKNLASKQKWVEREYRVQEDADVLHKYDKMLCDTNQFPSLPFCSTQTKLHGIIGLIKHYHV